MILRPSRGCWVPFFFLVKNVVLDARREVVLVLSRSEAQAFYDRFGKKQDWQSFYEDPALDRLIAYADFEHAEQIFELGCGTGRFAAQLFSGHLSPSATYLGVDSSSTMVRLASERLAPAGSRARVAQTDGSPHFPVDDRSVDRVVAAFVFDLLSDADIQEALREAHRVLETGGKLCLVSLCGGATPLSRLVAGLWTILFRVQASLVGGCRPIRLEAYVDRGLWKVQHQCVVVSCGLPLEVIVAVRVDRGSPAARSS